MRPSRTEDCPSIEPGTVPIRGELIQGLVGKLGFDLRTASIRELNRIVDQLERQAGVRFIRMEFGIPGLPVNPIAIEAEIAALRDRQVGHIYAPFDGLPALKEEAARFVKLFMDMEVPAACCIPTVGAMQGCFASLCVAGRRHPGRRTVLCLEPGFPVNKLQIRMLGLERDAIDFYDHRGDVLVRAVAERARRGDVCAVLWSSPNNPSWIVLRESELAGIGRVCDEHDLLAIEDLAYFGMDVRHDYTRPGRPPFQPTILRHTRRGISVVSSSKMFSYAGQRIAITVLHPELMRLEAPGLREFYGTSDVVHALVHGVLYPMTACVAEGPQHGLLALLRAANDGDASLFAPAREYARRARVMKALFLEHGFRLVYDNDLGEPLADGFYFTIGHPAYADGVDLLRELLRYGISAITLETTGSCRHEGLRACVSLVGDADFEVLRERLERFRADHPR